MNLSKLQLKKLIPLALILSVCVGHQAAADSVTVSETWQDNTSGGIYSGSTDSGTFNVSLTVSSMSSFTADNWSNLLVTISTGSLNTGYFSDTMANAPNYGGKVSATSATFYFQSSDTNGDLVNAYQMTFSRSGTAFTISGRTLNPPAVQPPWSILAQDYIDFSGAGTSSAITDEASCEIVLQDADSSTQYADLSTGLLISGKDTITYDAEDTELDNVQVSGTADLTPPALTLISPAGSLTSTNGLVTVQVRATDAAGVAGVEFYLNGLDYGQGVLGNSSLWSMNFALLPGANVIQAVATDSVGNSSTESLTVTYVNPQTSADAIVFSEHWLDSAPTNSDGAQSDVSQDVGVLNAAWQVASLPGLSASAWSNLVFTVSFGEVAFSNRLAAADILTTSNATFYLQTVSDPSGSSLTDEQLIIARSGATLSLIWETGNPINAADNPIIAGWYTNYHGTGGAIVDQQTFSLALRDGNTLTPYTNVSRTVYITGSDVVSYDANSNRLNAVQVSGTANLAPPTVVAVSPAGLLTTTNDLLTARFMVTDPFGVAGVKFYLNGADYGPGILGSSNLWSMNFALLPGTNLIQVQAADLLGNISPTNTVAVIYVNRQTNASMITFSEHWLDSSQSNSAAGLFVVRQDIGTLNAALLVPGLKNFAASTWSNLVLKVSFGDVTFSNSLANANVLTASNAVFFVNTALDASHNPLTDTYLSVTRSSNTLVLAAETGNPTYVDQSNPIIADNYLGNGSPVQDAEPFALTLQDGNTLSIYAKVSQTVYISGTDAVTYDPQTNELDNVQIAGAATFLPPTLTVVAPATGAQLTNGLVTVGVRATDNIFGVGNVEFFLNNQYFGLGNQGNSNLWTMNFALAVGSNTVQMVATDILGNNPATNSLQLVYVNRQTNANLVTVLEHWLDITGTVFDRPPCCNSYLISQDTGLLNAALNVPHLQTMSASTWSNLSLTLSLGNFAVAESLSDADLLTTNKAVFYFTDPNDTNVPPANVEQLTVSRAGNTLLLVARAGNPTYLSPDGNYFLAGNYLGVGGSFPDQPSFVLTLQDGTTQNLYANVSQPIFIAGSDTVTHDSYGNVLNNVWVSGTADFIAPTNTITSPVAGQRCSNAVFTVTGKARDNMAVTNVFCSVNGVWSSAVTANHWTNWTAQVALTPGTNSLASYAVDSSGNVSATNTVALVYVLSAVVTVNVGAGGTVTPNDNGALLQLGQNYTLTAKTNAGFAFAGWTGSIVTNSALLTFQMTSNLVLNANFVDVAKPTNAITAPVNGQRWSNVVFTVTGRAGDNVAVSNVFCSLNHGVWSSAVTTNHWSTWTALVTLTPGTNVISAYAVDTSGNVSITSTVRVDYVASALLTVQIVGAGTVTPNLNGQLLAIGQNYSMTAAASNGFAFYFWGWGVATNAMSMTNNKTLGFNMASNLVIVAHFVDVAKPTNGIGFPTANQKWSNSVISVTGKAGDNVGVAGVWYQINQGGWAPAQTANGYTNWSAQNLPVTLGTNTLQAYAMDAAGNVSTTNVLKFLGVVAPASLAGYAAILKPSVGTQQVAFAWGDGTYSQAGVGSDTNADDYGAGVFDYVPTSSNTALITNMDVGMLSALGVTNVTVWNVTFTNPTTATYVWTNAPDSGAGTMTILPVGNLVPATLAGKTIKIYQGTALISTIVLNTGGTFNSTNKNGSHNGTYDFVQYSPTVVILHQDFTDGSNAGGSQYLELNFSSTTAGQAFGSYYDQPAYGGSPNDTAVGTFTIAPTP